MNWRSCRYLKRQVFLVRRAGALFTNFQNSNFQGLHVVGYAGIAICQFTPARIVPECQPFNLPNGSLGPVYQVICNRCTYTSPLSSILFCGTSFEATRILHFVDTK
jgi:hypothetical protein